MHLVDGLKINYEDEVTTLFDGEGKPIINTRGYCNMELLEEFIWLYKSRVENYKGTYSDMFFK